MNNNDNITMTTKLPPKDKMVKLAWGDRILIDPGYIRGVYAEWNGLEPRFDGLKCEKTIHSGDDGYYAITAKHANGKSHGIIADLGVDSGRIWQLVAEFEVYLDLDAGLSGYHIIREKDMADYQDIEIVKGGDNE